MGVLDSNGYKVTIENGVMKVVRGAFLAMKGTLKKNLYFLDGQIVTGSVAVSNNFEDDESDMVKKEELESSFFSSSFPSYPPYMHHWEEEK